MIHRVKREQACAREKLRRPTAASRRAFEVTTGSLALILDRTDINTSTSTGSCFPRDAGMRVGG